MEGMGRHNGHLPCKRMEKQRGYRRPSGKIRTVFLLSDLKSTINNDGFFSVFYNEPPYAIKRLRRAIELSGVKSASDLFDEAFQLIANRFTWSNEHENFVGQTGGTSPYEFFGDEITQRLEEIEKEVSGILYTDDFEKLLETYAKS